MKMKKILSIIAMQLVAALWLTATAAYYNGQTIKAKTTEGVEMSFDIIDTNAKTCRIAYQCISTSTIGKVTVPTSVEGFTVVEASGSAFYNCKSITSVTLPYYLKKLNVNTFWNCEALTEVSLPNNLEEMGEWTFDNCKKLKSVTIPSKITNIPRCTFYNCESLESVKFPAVIDSIFSDAFYYCKALQSVALPSTVKYIDSYTFYNCTSLKTITGIANLEYIGSSAFYNTPWLENLPAGMIYLGKVAFKYKGTIPDNTTINIKEGTTYIAPSAFSGSGLVAVTIPASVTSIGSSAFGSHPGLNSISVATANKVYNSLGNCNAVIETATNTLIVGCNTTVFPSTVKAIGYYAFFGSTIASMTIPDAVDSIANYAFYSCNKMKSLTVGKGVRKIGNSAFAYCDNLKDIVVSSANPYFDSRDNCKAIVEKSTNTLVVGCMATVIPTTVKAIGDYAFQTCSSSALYTFTIPDQIEKIGTNVFAYHSYMRSATIGRSVKEIGSDAFYGCNNLTAIHALMDTPCEIKENVFQKSVSAERDSIYNNATLYVPIGSRINYMSTAGWSKFKHIVETDGTTLMDGDVFTATTVEGHLLTYQVKSRTQKTCELIGSPIDIAGTVTIPQKTNGFSVTAIGANVFYCSGNDRNLTSAILPEGIVSIGDYAFYHNNRNLVISQLPSTLESIGIYAFGYCKNTAIHIPAKVKTIGRSAFCACNQLTTITVDAANTVFTSPAGSNAIVRKDNKTLVAGCKTTVIPDDVECIGEYAFNSIGLTSIDIPASVTTIERMAFNNTSLSSVTIPATVRSIGEEAFRWSNELVAVYSPNETPFSIPDNAFRHPKPKTEDTYKIATLYVPRGKKAAYQATDGWKLFENIEESDFGIETAILGDVDYLLDGTALTATVKLIHADHADVVIPETLNYDGKSYQVTAIADSVFCSDTESFIFSVTFPATIKKVSQKAFWRYNPSAIVWQSETKIPEGAFNNPYYKGCNFLLYVKLSSVAPSGVENVIVGGQAGEIVLNDSWQFNCPQEFNASKISLTHNYTLQTGMGTSAGWETIALPFDVKTITHETKGRLVPFAAYEEGSDHKPFWLYSLGNNGFVKASAIKANTPYIISMPNNENYTSRYNIPGKVTFAATNAKVYRSGDSYLNTATSGGATFRPCYAYYLNTTGIYVLNVPTAISPYVGTEAPGSVFLTGGNIVVYPFGARIEKSSSARSIDIVFADEDGDKALGIITTTPQGGGDQSLKVYSLSGQLIGVYTHDDLFGPDRKLPAGVYVVNGKKVNVK